MVFQYFPKAHILRHPFFVSILLVAICVNSFANAEPAIYDVEGKFQAVFPKSPQFVGILGSGNYKIRSFLAHDLTHNVMYRGAYGIGTLRYHKSYVPEALANFIKGEAITLDARITHESIGAIGGYHGAYYSLELVHRGHQAQIHGAVIYNGETFLTWAIQTLPNLSSQDGLELFNAYVDYFKAY